MKLFVITSMVMILLAVSSFAVMSITGSAAFITSSSSPSYAVGLTFKSIGTIGFELTAEGTIGNFSNLSQIGNISTWDLYPTIIISLPSGELRPYVGLGILTTYNVKTGFEPVNFNSFYYRAGTDIFLGSFSAFGEAQGTFANMSFSGIKEWRFGLGLAF